jgi:hypothetical protein
VEAATELLDTANVPVLLPGANETEAGTVTAAFELEREITIPSLGAGPLSVTVPVPEAPPAMLVGFSANAESATPTFAVSGIVNVEFAVITTLSWSCPP